MSDIYSTISANYLTVGQNTNLSSSKYVKVDPASFEGSWSGKYANGQSFTFSISNVSGFRAKARYQSGSVHNYQDVLIKDNSFRIGDSKFALQRKGVAQVKTVMSDPVSGASTLETS